MLDTMTFLMFVTTGMQLWRTHKQWQAYQRREITRGQVVNLITTTVFMAAATVGLFALSRLTG